MAKKKLMTSQDKAEYILNKFLENHGEEYWQIGKTDFLKRCLVAVLELKNCEEDYIKNNNEDFNFWPFFDGIDLGELNNFWKININNPKILPDDSLLGLQEVDVRKSENDNSNLHIFPVFDRLDDDTHTNKIVGIKFSLSSQMGYEINYKNVELDELKNIQKKLDLYIDKIENGSRITVFGYGSKYEFNSTSSNDLSEADLRYRSEVFRDGHGLPDIFKVVKVERNEIGDETWYVEGFEDEKIDNYKIKIIDYPCTFTFIASKPFKRYNKKVEYDDERQEFLYSKMKQFNLPSNGHSYEDFIIERVEKIENGEEWILGS